MIEYRAYETSESSAIATLFTGVFTESEDEAEGALIGNLVKELIADTDGRDLYGFVAADEAQILGAIFFSRLTFERDIDVFILSPVAIDSELQGKGVGQKLITHGLQELKRQGVKIVITYGDPTFYCKVGFHPLSENVIRAPLELSQPEGWLGQSLTGEPIEPIAGRCTCVKALNNLVYW